MRAENTHEPIISDSDFEAVQNLLQTDGRVSPESKSLKSIHGTSVLQGLRRTDGAAQESGIKESNKVYLYLFHKNQGEGCSRHSIEENTLKGIGWALRFADMPMTFSAE